MAAPSEKAWRKADGSVVIRVRLTPKSSSEAICGQLATAEGPALAARVRAAPEGGKANAALEAVVAKWLGVPRTAVSLAAGAKGRIKSVRVSGPPDAIEQRIAAGLRALDGSRNG